MERSRAVQEKVSIHAKEAGEQRNNRNEGDKIW